jgi:hypothetical protein
MYRKLQMTMQDEWLLSMLVVLILSAVTGVAADGVPATVEIVARADVPNSVVPQGEVRLARQGDDTIVRSILQTRFLKRAQNRIIGKERQNWGDHADATAYLEALAAAFVEYEARKADAGKHVALAIDFIDGPRSARVDFSFPPVSRDEHGYHTPPADAWRSLALSRAYVRRDQELILADVFEKRATALIERLQTYRALQGETEHE